MSATERIENPFSPRKAAPARTDAGPAERVEPRPIARTDLPVRAMTGYEEEVIERRLADPNTAALCNEIVARCLVPPGEDPSAAYERVRALSVPERDLALVRIRELSLGDSVECEVRCPACRAKCSIDFRLSNLPLSIGPIPRELEVTLPDGTHVVMRPPSAGDQEDLLAAKLETESERRSFVLGRVITRFGDRPGPLGLEGAKALGLQARRALEAALEERVPDLDLRMAVTCAECGHEFTSPFDVAAFFLPR